MPWKRIVLKQKMEHILASSEKVKFAYLFGSQAKGSPGPLSDIDIAVFFDETEYNQGNAFEDENELMFKLEKTLAPERVDLVVLNKAPVFLRHQILKNGELILCRADKERIRFHEATMRLYLDFQPFRSVQNYYWKSEFVKVRSGGEP